ncbi:hypothetical protein P7K49_000664 [Saguinus oedipus]|uniref:Uncharacterized protein n=1 Tax=Saguinus oedipus TaxID=9490 RepID=A0ABQ9WC97_SAGOE|nr:hypothetical protein P7K49_000664 [Saguinus oedipus]
MCKGAPVGCPLLGQLSCRQKQETSRATPLPICNDGYLALILQYELAEVIRVKELYDHIYFRILSRHVKEVQALKSEMKNEQACKELISAEDWTSKSTYPEGWALKRETVRIQNGLQPEAKQMKSWFHCEIQVLSTLLTFREIKDFERFLSGAVVRLETNLEVWLEVQWKRESSILAVLQDVAGKTGLEIPPLPPNLQVNCDLLSGCLQGSIKSHVSALVGSAVNLVRHMHYPTSPQTWPETATQGLCTS